MEPAIPLRLSIRTVIWLDPVCVICAVAVSGPTLTFTAFGPPAGSAVIVRPCAPVALASASNEISAVPVIWSAVALLKLG